MTLPSQNNQSEHSSALTNPQITIRHASQTKQRSTNTPRGEVTHKGLSRGNQIKPTILTTDLDMK